VPIAIPVGAPNVNENDYGLLKMAAFHAQQIAREGYAAYSENLRYDYLEGKANMSITEGLGIRYVQGPHPQFGSPDAKP
jgi:hypothetical protein